MIGRVVVLGEYRGREAAALVVDGQLADLLIEADSDSFSPGAILRGIVDRPMKGLGGVFVKLPGLSGFLRETSGLAPGQPVLVQVSGHTEPGKALPVSSRLLFKSRLAIVTPSVPGLNV
ncbi:MAG: ribonuclease G, partial [Paracoccaceae bacterium]|nr:ribonuclease G [Paracoccaceae bacterium]